MDDETLVMFGDFAVKAERMDGGGVKVGGYLVRYGGQDLEGEHFEADTDFDVDLPGKTSTYFHHGQDSKVGKRKLSRAELRGDEVGIWAETILQERDEYERFIAELALAGKLGWSSGSVSHLVERDGSKITRWPIAEASLTHTPAEPRNMVMQLKSLLLTPAPEATREAAAAVEEIETLSEPTEVKNMEITEEKLSELLDASATKAVEAFQKAAPAVVTKAGSAAVEVVKDEGDQPFETFGDQLKAIADYELSNRRKFDPRLAGKSTKATGMNEGLPSEGGFAVQQDFVPGLLKNAYDTGVLASRVRRFGVSANANGLKINAIAETSRVTGSRMGGLQTYWLGEGGTKTPTMPALRQMVLDLKKLIGLYYATDELLQDSGALQSVVSQGFADEFGWMIDQAILNGPGGAQPLGITASPALVTVAAEAGQLADTIVHENIVKMYSRMYARSRANAIWVYNQDVEPQLFTMGLAVGTGGVPSFMPPGGLSGAPYGTLMGRPAIPMEQCATLGNVGDIMFIDPSQYIAIDKGGIQTASSIHITFLTDETAFRFVYRFDGQPAWVAPLTPATGSANTLSPFVALAAR